MIRKYLNLMNKYSSLWLNNLDHFTNPLSGDFECDVAIIGAGVSGISTAYHLLEKGLRIAVFEKNILGSGSTGHSGGFLAASAILVYLSKRVKRTSLVK